MSFESISLLFFFFNWTPLHGGRTREWTKGETSIQTGCMVQLFPCKDNGAKPQSSFIISFLGDFQYLNRPSPEQLVLACYDHGFGLKISWNLFQNELLHDPMLVQSKTPSEFELLSQVFAKVFHTEYSTKRESCYLLTDFWKCWVNISSTIEELLLRQDRIWFTLRINMWLSWLWGPLYFYSLIVICCPGCTPNEAGIHHRLVYCVILIHCLGRLIWCNK